MGKRISECFRYSISVGNHLFATGDGHSSALLFCRLEGSYYIGRGDAEFEDWLANLRTKHPETKLYEGAEIVLRTPSGELFMKSRIGAALGLRQKGFEHA